MHGNVFLEAKKFEKHGTALNSVPVETDGNFRQLHLKLSKTISSF